MVWEEKNRKKNEENILKLILRKKKKLKKITFSYRIFTYISISGPDTPWSLSYQKISSACATQRSYENQT
jgi:hypothetical protein